MIRPVGDQHVVKDRDGELVYIGTDVDEVMRLYRLAVEAANALPPSDPT